MSPSDPRTLLDTATRDLPVEVAHAPLAAIHRRVRRRRARLTAGYAAVAALLAAGLVPLLHGPAAAPEPARPSPSADGLPWSFVYRDGDQAKVYLHRQDCQVLDSPAAVVEPHGDTATLSVTGALRRADDCTRAGIPMVELAPNALGTARILIDPVTGGRPPVYDRAHLPLSWKGMALNGHGAVARNTEPEQFTARYASAMLVADAPELEIRGVDPARPTPSGEPLRVGPVDGVLYHELGEFRFVWRVRVPGGTDVGYEVVPSGLSVSRAEFVAMLAELAWGR